MTESHGHSHVHIHDESDGVWWQLVASSGILAIGLYLHYFLEAGFLSRALLLVVLSLTGYKIAYLGIKSLFLGDVTIDLLVTIAAIGAAAIGHLEEAASVMLLFNLAEQLEGYATERARNAIRSLMDLRPEVALIRKDSSEVEVPIEEVLPGEVFILRPGDKVPLDGRVVEGVSNVNQATITGESRPILKMKGGEVFAGTINIDGFLAVKTTRMAEETVLSKILKMVEEAEESRSETEAFVDRFSRWYTPSIIFFAVIVATVPPLLFRHHFDKWVYRSLVMLVVACPCALAISTPVAMVSSITSASRNGVLIKGSTYIEQMSDASVITFDKTGTLTKGELDVVDIIAFDLTEKAVLRRAAALEAKSSHPIARAIMERAKREGITPQEATEFKSYLGRGVQACIDEKTCIIGNMRLFQELEIDFVKEVIEGIESEGKTVVLVAEEGKFIGALALMDRLREDAYRAVKALQDRGLRVEMLTGDNDETARAIAERLGVNGYRANLLPDEKVLAIDELRDLGSIVMVGDGVNDAPALAAADVGIAMGAMGSDVALETADVALMRDDLSKLSYALDLSQATMRRVKENISISLMVKLGVAALAIPGIVTLWIAVALGDAGLSLAVVLNSIRLGAIKAEGR
ncbi:MAG: heavy metal translocating P-type ATPase [Candidatus Bathyarchaeia archaeon]